MENLIETIVALIITSGLIFGSTKSLIWVHDEIKKESLRQVSQGLSSSEALANALSNESLEF